MFKLHTKSCLIPGENVYIPPLIASKTGVGVAASFRGGFLFYPGMLFS